MVAIHFNAEDEPAKTRADYWQHIVASAFQPYQFHAADGSFRSRVRQARIGPLNVLDFRMSAARGALQAARTPDLIRNSDLGMVKIDLGMRGFGRYEQDGRQSLLTPGHFHLMDPSRSSRVTVAAAHDVSVLAFPRELLPVGEKNLRDLTAIPFSAQDPYAALVVSLGRELMRHLESYEGDRDARIGTAFLDLLALAVATRLDRVSVVPAGSRQQATLLRIRTFIERHLGDPALSPAQIAAAHNISIRTLHKLYETEDDTVAACIRHLRLERCRQDLLDPSLRRRPAGAIGARWGFPDASAFSRAFRSAYGLPPAEYRTSHVG